MYPWKDAIASLANKTHFSIDALGIITMLGAEEINASVGRLLASRYVEFLPYLGAFVLAGDRIRSKPSGFTLYGLKRGIRTNELSGWFARWLKAQDFHQTHHKVEWRILDDEQRVPIKRARFMSKLVALFLGLLLNGLLLATSVLAGDWCGFANVVSMLTSIAVRVFVLSQNRHGVDNAIHDAIGNAVIRKRKQFARPDNLSDLAGANKQDDERRRLQNSSAFNGNKFTLRGRWAECGITPEEINNVVQERGKAIVILDDSRCVYIEAPELLLGLVFATTPGIPNPLAYWIARCIGWAAFGVQVITLGISTLPVQIATVVLLLSASVLAVMKFGCEDSSIWKTMRHHINSVGLMKHFAKANSTVQSFDLSGSTTCLIGSLLQATCSQIDRKCTCDATPPCGSCAESSKDVEQQGYPTCNSSRRQDLFVWLKLEDAEEDLLEQWGLLPSRKRNESWWIEYNTKKKEFLREKTQQK